MGEAQGLVARTQSIKCVMTSPAQFPNLVFDVGRLFRQDLDIQIACFFTQTNMVTYLFRWMASQHGHREQFAVAILFHVLQNQPYEFPIAAHNPILTQGSLT